MDGKSLSAKSFYNNLIIFIGATLIAAVPAISYVIANDNDAQFPRVISALSAVATFIFVHFTYRYLSSIRAVRRKIYSQSLMEGTWIQLFRNPIKKSSEADFAIIWIAYNKQRGNLTFVGRTYNGAEFVSTSLANSIACFHSNTLSLDAENHILTYSWQTEEFFNNEEEEPVFHTYGTGRWHFVPAGKLYTRAAGSFIRDAITPTRHIHSCWKLSNRQLTTSEIHLCLFNPPAPSKWKPKSLSRLQPIQDLERLSTRLRRFVSNNTTE